MQYKCGENLAPLLTRAERLQARRAAVKERLDGPHRRPRLTAPPNASVFTGRTVQILTHLLVEQRLTAPPNASVFVLFYQ